MRRFGLPLAFLVLTVGLLSAAPPEEEELPAKPPAKAPGIPPAKEPGIPPGQPAPPPPPADKEKEDAPSGYLARLPDMVREANAASDPVLKEFFGLFPVAFDKLTVGLRAAVRVTPLPLVWGKDAYPKEFGYAPFDAANVAQEPKTVTLKTVREVEYFENIVVAEADKLLARPPAAGLPPLADRLAAAEKALVSAYFFHDSARERNRRRGKSWEPIKQALYAKLAEVRVGRLTAAGEAREWAKLNDLSDRYFELYKATPAVLEKVSAARLAEAESLAKSDVAAELERSRAILAEHEARFPASQAPALGRVRQALGAKAKAFLTRAEQTAGANKSQARSLLATVEKIDPDNAGLRALRQELSVYPVLVVGARQRPELMSPTRVRFDSEKQAAELMFEGLLEPVPDDAAGLRFRPALAAALPVVGGGGRDVRLVGSATWATDGVGPLTAADVAGTVRLLRQVPHLWAADPTAWLADPGLSPEDPNHVHLRFRTGHPDPRGLLALKVLPATWLLEKTKPANDEEFARNPFGTGPFRLAASAAPSSPGLPADVVFIANGAYARRPGRVAQPFIKEVRFTPLDPAADLPADFRAGRLHILTDVPTSDLSKFQQDNNLRGAVRVATAIDPKRVHMLAINHRRPTLQSTELRRGLSHAIDRNRILADVFRGPGGPEEFHKPLAGPFPPGSWATPKPLGGPPPALYNRDLAAAQIREYLKSPSAATTLTLAYPNDDAQAKLACERVKLMVESLTEKDGRKLGLRLDPLPPAELLRQVEVENRYDLAYLPLDYRDVWFPLTLGSLLDPAAAVPGGRNSSGYLAKGTNPSPSDLALGQMLAEARLYRDPLGKLVPLADRLHKQFNDAVPFVPLWQLDRHLVVATAVKIRFPGETADADPSRLDPTTLFTGVGEWRLE